MNWLIRVYSGGFSKTVALSDEVRNAVNKFKQKLSHFLYETYTNIRIDHLFNIIIGTFNLYIYKDLLHSFIQLLIQLHATFFFRISRVAACGG